jgi:hypothetical protein
MIQIKGYFWNKESFLEICIQQVPRRAFKFRFTKTPKLWNIRAEIS